MKKIILGMLVLAAITGTSCKKDKKNASCESTVAGIAGNFKLTGAYLTINGSGGDAFSTIPSCTKSAIFSLKSDKTTVYTESGSCSTTPINGNWDVVSGKITIQSGYDIDDATINSWDCTTLVVTEDNSGSGITSTIKYTFTKQ